MAVLVVIGCGRAATVAKKAMANIESKSQSSVTGTATFTQEGEGEVALTLELSGAVPGQRAVHIHEKGDCSAADGTSAGPHWNPTANPHGHLGEEDDVHVSGGTATSGTAGHHAGDIGNVTVKADGTATFTMKTSEWTIGGGDGGTKDIVGRSVVVHGGTDDYVSQPAGDAGIRVGCGVIRAQ